AERREEIFRSNPAIPFPVDLSCKSARSRGRSIRLLTRQLFRALSFLTGAPKSLSCFTPRHTWQGGVWHGGSVFLVAFESQRHRRDRKSTRLNSSHVAISYAVFCLKKKKKKYKYISSILYH